VPLPLALLAAVLIAAPRTGAAQQTAAPAANSTSGERFKNVQVLKDLPADQLHDVMTYMAAAMGGNCSTCHVRGVDGEFAYEKDDNDHKAAARTMIQMVRAINTQHFKGEDRVTCATCHQARREPSPLPPLSQPMSADQLAQMAERAAAGRQGAAPGGATPGQPAAGRGAAGPAGRGGQSSRRGFEQGHWRTEPDRRRR
jgi:hypothetical protein